MNALLSMPLPGGTTKPKQIKVVKEEFVKYVTKVVYKDKPCDLNEMCEQVAELVCQEKFKLIDFQNMMRKAIVQKVIEKNHNCKTTAAKKLGVNRATITNVLKGDLVK